MQNVNLEQEVINLSKEKWHWMSERKVDSLDALFHEKAVFVHSHQKWSDSLQGCGYPGSVGAFYWRDNCHPFEQNSSGGCCWRQ
jgi:hypothetical protein